MQTAVMETERTVFLPDAVSERRRRRWTGRRDDAVINKKQQEACNEKKGTEPGGSVFSGHDVSAQTRPRRRECGLGESDGTQV